MVFLVILVAAGVVALLVLPILDVQEAWDLDERPDRLRILRRSKDRIMRALKDLEADYREGSLAEDDYDELRASYKRQAVDVTRELNVVRETVIRQIQDDPSRPLTRKELAAVEKLVARKRKKHASA